MALVARPSAFVTFAPRIVANRAISVAIALAVVPWRRALVPVAPIITVIRVIALLAVVGRLALVTLAARVCRGLVFRLDLTGRVVVPHRGASREEARPKGAVRLAMNKAALRLRGSSFSEADEAGRAQPPTRLPAPDRVAARRSRTPARA